jgi:WD40 repeat protein
LLLAASRLGNVFLLSLDGRVVHKFPDIPMKEGFVSAVALSDDNRNVAIGTTKGLVLYRFENGVEARLTAEGDTTEVDSVLFARNGPLIGGLADGKLRFWTEEGKLVRTVPGHDYAIQTLALSPDGKTLATAGMPYLFADIVAKVKPVTKLWDLQGNPLGQFPSHFTHCLRFTPDGEDLVSSGRLDNAVNIYRRSGERLRTITVGTAEHRSSNLVALAPDGRKLITADNDVDPPVLGIWKIDGEFERALRGLSGPMTNVSTSPDGNFIVTLSADRLVRIWSITGRLVASLPGHKEYSTGLAYAPNGMYFASGSIRSWKSSFIKLAIEGRNCHPAPTISLSFLKAFS